MDSMGADGRAAIFRASHVTYGFRYLGKIVAQMGPCPHILRLLLNKGEAHTRRVCLDELCDQVLAERVELFDPDDGNIASLQPGVFFEQFIIDLAAAEKRPGHAKGAGAVGDHLPEAAPLQLFERGNAAWVTQQALGRKDDQGLAEGLLELAAQQMEHLRRC